MEIIAKFLVFNHLTTKASGAKKILNGRFMHSYA
jgi:hypothetical protein